MDVEREMKKRSLAAALQQAALAQGCYGSDEPLFYDFAEQVLQNNETRESRKG